MPADWPAPMPEAELLALVHRRARAISARRLARRAAALLLGAATVAGSLSVLDRGSQSAVRMADHDPTSQEEAQADDRAAPAAGPTSSGAASDGNAPHAAGKAGSGAPALPPPVAASTASKEPVPPVPLVTDPRGDDRPRNAGVDLLWGDIAYDQATDAFRFTLAVARLAAAPSRVSYGFAFDYDGGRYSVAVERWDDGSSAVLAVGSGCAECSVVYDTATNAVHIVVPRSELDERIAYTSAHTYSAGAPTGRHPSPPLRRGAVFGRPGLRADLSLEAPLSNANPDGPNDVAESDGRWTMP